MSNAGEPVPRDPWFGLSVKFWINLFQDWTVIGFAAASVFLIRVVFAPWRSFWPMALIFGLAIGVVMSDLVVRLVRFLWTRR